MSALLLAPVLLGLGVAVAFLVLLLAFFAGVEMLGAAERRRHRMDYPEATIRNVIYPGDLG